MLCCLIGAGLVVWLRRSAGRSAGRPLHPLLGFVFGLGAGMLVVELIVTVLVPLGVVQATGPMLGRIAAVVIPGLVAVAAARAGAAGALLDRAGTAAVTFATVGGALVAEEIDLHLFTLYSAPGVLAGVAVHLPGFVFLAAGLVWRSKLPGEAAAAACACPTAPAGPISPAGGR